MHNILFPPLHGNALGGRDKPRFLLTRRNVGGQWKTDRSLVGMSSWSCNLLEVALPH